MTFGLSTRNLANFVNLDENLRAFRYLSKYQISDGEGGSTIIEVSCVGTPLVFVSLLPNDVGGPGGNTGISIQSIYAVGGNRWRVQCAGDNASSGIHYLRVFGRLDLNPPPAQRWGLQVYNVQAAMVFDSGANMLRLGFYAGPATITIPIVANIEFHDYGFPASLVNKSICALPSGRAYQVIDDGPVFDGDGDNYNVVTYGHSLSWLSSSPNALRVITSPIDSQRFASSGYPGVNSPGGSQVVPVSFIDNAQYP